MSYTEKHIAILSGRDAVRRRPGMYIGSTDRRGLHHLVFELIDNAVDERLAGYGDHIHIQLFEDGACSVSDNGRGIPVQVIPEDGRSACEVVLTTLHAGSKFGNGAYKVSGGLHGVGLSCVNALSEWLQVDIQRDGFSHQQRFSRGLPDGPLERIGESQAVGTAIKFLPDARIFRQELDFDPEVICWRAEELAYLNPGLRISVMTPDHTWHTYCFDNGISDFVHKLSKGRRPIHEDVIALDGQAGELQVRLGLRWTALYDEEVLTYVNAIRTHDGGVHLMALHEGVFEVIRGCSVNSGVEPELLAPSDIREGMTAVLSILIPEPEFEGQTKNRLTNPEVGEQIKAIVIEQLQRHFDDHPVMMRRIIQRCTEAAKARLAADQAGAAARYQLAPEIATPEVYRHQFGERSKNWHDSATWITHDELLSAHGNMCVMPPDSVCLDVCCGSGVVGNSFKGKVSKIIGLDITPEMVELAKTRLDEVVLGTVYDIPFPDNHFEVVCNREVMHLMPDPMKMMREVVRVLKPGGQFVVGQILPFGPEDAAWMYRIFKKKQPLLYHMFQDEDFENLLVESGLVDIQKQDLRVWESIDVWIDTIETSALHRFEIRKLFHEAPEHVKRIHPFEIQPSGKIQDCWRWVVYSARKPEQ